MRAGKEAIVSKVIVSCMHALSLVLGPKHVSSVIFCHSNTSKATRCPSHLHT